MIVLELVSFVTSTVSFLYFRPQSQIIFGLRRLLHVEVVIVVASKLFASLKFKAFLH